MLKIFKPKKVKKAFDITAVVIALLCVIGAVANSISIIMIALVLSILSLFLHIFFYRCPNCGKHLGRDSGDYCHHCGVKLDDF